MSLTFGEISRVKFYLGATILGGQLCCGVMVHSLVACIWTARKTCPLGSVRRGKTSSFLEQSLRSFPIQETIQIQSNPQVLKAIQKQAGRVESNPKARLRS